MRPGVSVVVPVYNVRDYLPRCVDALRAQTLKEVEFVFVDDGSTDGSGESLDRAAAVDARIRVIHQPNAGAGVARNVGLDAADGEYVFFFDPDDTCSRDMLEGLSVRARRTSADIVVAGKYFVDATSGRTLGRKGFDRGLWRLPQPFAPEAAGSRLFTFAKSVPWDKLFRRGFVVESGLRFQAVRRCNDVFFVDLALALASRIALDPHAYYRYSVDRPNSLQSAKDKAPRAVADAYSAVERELRARGRWSALREAYLSIYLLSMSYNLVRLVVPANVEACFRELRQTLSRLSAEGLGEDGLHTPWQRKLYRAAMADETGAELTALARRGKGEADRPTLKSRLVDVLPFSWHERWKRLTADFL